MTVGYREAGDAAAAVRWLGARPGGPGPLILYGVSMGAVAILRAEVELGARPAANVLEYLFSSLRQTARNRFTAMHVPACPLTDLLVFWGGVQNDFWGPGLSTEQYAAHIGGPHPTAMGHHRRLRDPRRNRCYFPQPPGPQEATQLRGRGARAVLAPLPSRVAGAD